MQQKKLAEFLSFLGERSEADFKKDDVDRYLTRYRLDTKDLLPYMNFRKDTYARNLIFKTDLYELIMLTWLPEHRTPIHDHAGQRCWMILQSGKLTFKNYKPAPNLDSPLEVEGPSETHEAGEAVYIDDGIGVHAIANASSEPAVSLHLYAAPIPSCRIYNEASRKFEWKVLEFSTPAGSF